MFTVLSYLSALIDIQIIAGRVNRHTESGVGIHRAFRDVEGRSGDRECRRDELFDGITETVYVDGAAGGDRQIAGAFEGRNGSKWFAAGGIHFDAEVVPGV